MNETNIRWTDYTWNPVHGCSKTSEGCMNCYAAKLSYERQGWTDKPWTIDNAEDNVTPKPDRLSGSQSPEALSEPGWVFVNSMSDLLHPQVKGHFVREVLSACREAPRSAFQILTKHGPDAERPMPKCPTNVMLGVSVESPRRRYRIDWLREQQAEVKFVSFEPLVECIPGTHLDLTGIDWAIIGGESGPEDRRREMDPAWARNVIRACRRQNTSVFFKQHSGPRPENKVTLGGDRIEEFPELPRPIVPSPREFLKEAARA